MLDTLLVIILVGFFIAGLVHGLVRQVGSLIAFFVSLWVAHAWYGQLALYIKPSLDQWKFIADPLSSALAFFILFAVVGFILGLFVKLIDRIINTAPLIPFLRSANRLGGACVGLVEGLLLTSAIVYVVSLFAVMGPIGTALKESSIAPRLISLAQFIKPLLPDFSEYIPKFQLPSLNNLGGIDQKNIDPKLLQKLQGINLNTIKPEQIPELLNLLEKVQQKK